MCRVREPPFSCFLSENPLFSGTLLKFHWKTISCGSKVQPTLNGSAFSNRPWIFSLCCCSFSCCLLRVSCAFSSSSSNTTLCIQTKYFLQALLTLEFYISILTATTAEYVTLIMQMQRAVVGRLYSWWWSKKFVTGAKVTVTPGLKCDASPFPHPPLSYNGRIVRPSVFCVFHNFRVATHWDRIPWHSPDFSLTKGQFSLTIQGKSLGNKTNNEPTEINSYAWRFETQTPWLPRNLFPRSNG